MQEGSAKSSSSVSESEGSTSASMEGIAVDDSSGSGS